MSSGYVSFRCNVRDVFKKAKDGRSESEVVVIRAVEKLVMAYLSLAFRTESAYLAFSRRKFSKNRDNALTAARSVKARLDNVYPLKAYSRSRETARPEEEYFIVFGPTPCCDSVSTQVWRVGRGQKSQMVRECPTCGATFS